MVRLGDKWQSKPIRVVKVEVAGKELLLATDLEIETELIALIYRSRWQIELFFKWMKSILGKRPTKRAMELIRFYLMGYAELEEVMTLLGLEKPAK